MEEYVVRNLFLATRINYICSKVVYQICSSETHSSSSQSLQTVLKCRSNPWDPKFLVLRATWLVIWSLTNCFKEDDRFYLLRRRCVRNSKWTGLDAFAANETRIDKCLNTYLYSHYLKCPDFHLVYFSGRPKVPTFPAVGSESSRWGWSRAWLATTKAAVASAAEVAWGNRGSNSTLLKLSD